jgi:CRISPR/Cas system endoribonuclease Cas6 (RAMP superfamily)
LLSLSRYRVTFTARESLDLPSYLGSTLRGAFGHVFRSIACPAPAGRECPIPGQCPYHRIFESSPPPGSQALRTHEEIPRPFVIAPGWARPGDTEARTIVEPGGLLSFELVLIGRAQEFFPYFVVAFREIDRLGKGRRAVELATIEALDGKAGSPRLIYESSDNIVRGAAVPLAMSECGTAPPADGRMTIEFVTQTRLKHEGRFVRVPEFHILFRRLLGRLSSMARFHSEEALDVDFRGIIEKSRGVLLTQDDTKWTKLRRYSSRQGRPMEWEGICGRASYEGDLAPFWPYLCFGQHIHVGHGATFGLGKFLLGDAPTHWGR